MNTTPKMIGLALALSLGMSTAHANKIIPAESMITGITEETLKQLRNTNPNLKEIRVTRYRVVSAKINGQLPKPKIYYDLERAVPYVNCDPKASSSDTLSVETVHTQEVSFSKVQSNTVGASLEVSGQIGGVGASVAANFSATFETGQTNTTSTSQAVTKNKNVTLEPLHGTWLTPYGERYEYQNAPYEVVVEVTEAQSAIILPGQRTWLPIKLQSPYPRFTVTGQVTAKLPRGEMGLSNIPMNPEDTKANCPTSFDDIPVEYGAARKAPAAKATTAAPGGAAPAGRSHFVGVVPPNKRSLLKPPVAPKL